MFVPQYFVRLGQAHQISLKQPVQAAIGSVPLALGLPCGKIVLSVAVLSIIITAPLGALGMEAGYKSLPAKEELLRE